MADISNYFRQTTRNQNTRRRDLNEDNAVDEDEASVFRTNIFKKKKFLVSDNKLRFSTAREKYLKDQMLLQFESCSEIQVQNDSRATAMLETETDFSSDARAIRERVFKGKNKIGGDEKVYRGINAYVDHKAGGSHGPLRASAHIRVTAGIDYQPDICKDYKETGYCGYGDSCKFMHDRGDYKSGWQLEKEWDEKEKVRKRKLAQKQLGVEEDAEQSDENDDSLLFECGICREAFCDPVVTKCKHYFCQHCALKHHAKNKKCFVCNSPTLGIFNTAQEIRRRMVA